MEDNFVEPDFNGDSHGNGQRELTSPIMEKFEQNDEEGENERATTS